MMVHVLERRQWLPTDIATAWSFFSTPRNLALITPPELGLRIRGPFNDAPAHAGQLIHYTVRPLLGIPLRWTTVIAEVDAPHRFVDDQLRGPYRSWRHEHVFSPSEGGVDMHDRVVYELPLGAIGRAVHALWVRRRLMLIFDHRQRALAALFPRNA